MTVGFMATEDRQVDPATLEISMIRFFRERNGDFLAVDTGTNRYYYLGTIVAHYITRLTLPWPDGGSSHDTLFARRTTIVR
jgi:hypothetical protein